MGGTISGKMSKNALGDDHETMLRGTWVARLVKCLTLAQVTMPGLLD